MKTNLRIILQYIQHNPSRSSKEIHEGIENRIGYATVKRALTKLLDERLIVVEGKGRGSRYKISPVYDLFKPIVVEDYFKIEIDDRRIKENYNFELIPIFLPGIELFTEREKDRLDKLQSGYNHRIKILPNSQHNKELERLAIDLSWKSSQIEGNTYTLLETERLLKEKKTADGKTKDEASMLLNHKEAIDFIIKNPNYLNPLTTSRIEDIHRLLVKDLSVDRNIRTHRVGISGTNYRPLDNEYQIKEALYQMCHLINRKPYAPEKALLALLLLSYIQPFADGNKRTSRIVSNAVLINQGYCPISFRTVDSVEYKKAMLIFYEQNNIEAFKEIFIEQFEFAVDTYF